MDIISQVTSAMQTVLTTVADAAAVASGFLKRKRKLTGASMVQTLVFGWLANPQSTYDELAQAAGSIGIEITRQGIEQRLTQSAAQMLKTTLDQRSKSSLPAHKQFLCFLGSTVFTCRTVAGLHCLMNWLMCGAAVAPTPRPAAKHR